MQRLLRLLSDPTRLRILAAVEAEELAVGEIASVLGMSQSRISNHLRILKDGEALEARREGSWTFYRNALPDHSKHAPLWRTVRTELEGDDAFRKDAGRRRRVLDARRRLSREHFASGSGDGEWTLERGSLRDEILGSLVPRETVVVDAGCGDGFLTEVLAERFDSVIAVDHSPERLAAARERVSGGKVVFRPGELDELPLEDGSADVVFLSMVLHHVPEVAASLREAYRVLRPGGSVAVADLAPHRVEAMRERMGNLRLGLDPDQLTQSLEAAGFRAVRTLPVHDRLRAGRQHVLELFIATGTRPAASRNKRKTERSRS